MFYCFHKSSVIAQVIFTNDYFSLLKKKNGSKIKILHHRENGGKLRGYFHFLVLPATDDEKQANEYNW